MTAQFIWGKKSLYNLEGIHPDLLKVATLALKLSPHDFQIVDGLRTIEEQKINVAKGFSKTMRSRHLTGHAIDFAVLNSGHIDWYDIGNFVVISIAFQQAADQLKIKIERGATWKWKDYGHIQLDWGAYPK